MNFSSKVRIFFLRYSFSVVVFISSVFQMSDAYKKN